MLITTDYKWWTGNEAGPENNVIGCMAADRNRRLCRRIDWNDDRRELWECFVRSVIQREKSLFNTFISKHPSQFIKKSGADKRFQLSAFNHTNDCIGWSPPEKTGNYHVGINDDSYRQHLFSPAIFSSDFPYYFAEFFQRWLFFVSNSARNLPDRFANGFQHKSISAHGNHEFISFLCEPPKYRRQSEGRLPGKFNRYHKYPFWSIYIACSY